MNCQNYEIYVSMQKVRGDYAVSYKLVDAAKHKTVLMSTIDLQTKGLSGNVPDLIAVYIALAGFLIFKRERLIHVSCPVRLIVYTSNPLVADILSKRKQVWAEHLAEWTARIKELISLLNEDYILEVLFKVGSDLECDQLAMESLREDNDEPEKPSLSVLQPSRVGRG